MNNEFVVVAISQNEARVWSAGIEPDSPLMEFHRAHENAEHRKTREMREGGRYEDRVDPEYFEPIVQAVGAAEQILLVGHGTGKASEVLLFIKYLEHKHPALASKVVDTVDVDLGNTSNGQVLALAREWKVLNKFN